jgi:hypothetical protein
MTMPERILRAGINFTSVPELKYAHAVRLVNDLIGRIGEWQASAPIVVRPHLLDEHNLEMRVEIRTAPPVDEWSAILGDALHNFRSVYDSLVWAFAHLDGGRPAHPTRVAFPLTESEKDWNKVVRDILESVPPDMIERLRGLQAWANASNRDDHLLWILHRFDILDKHQRLISGDLHSTGMSFHEFELRLEPADTAAQSQTTISMPSDGVRVEADAVACTMTNTTHSFHPDLDYRAYLPVQLRIEGEDGRGAFILDFARELIERTREFIDILCLGQVNAGALAHARKLLGPSAVSTGVNDEGNVELIVTPFGPNQP